MCSWLDYSYHTGFGTGVSCLVRVAQRQDGGLHGAPAAIPALAPVPWYHCPAGGTPAGSITAGPGN